MNGQRHAENPLGSANSQNKDKILACADLSQLAGARKS